MVNPSTHKVTRAGGVFAAIVCLGFAGTDSNGFDSKLRARRTYVLAS